MKKSGDSQLIMVYLDDTEPIVMDGFASDWDFRYASKPHTRFLKGLLAINKEKADEVKLRGHPEYVGYVFPMPDGSFVRIQHMWSNIASKRAEEPIYNLIISGFMTHNKGEPTRIKGRILLLTEKLTEEEENDLDWDSDTLSESVNTVARDILGGHGDEMIDMLVHFGMDERQATALTEGMLSGKSLHELDQSVGDIPLDQLIQIANHLEERMKRGGRE